MHFTQVRWCRCFYLFFFSHLLPCLLLYVLSNIQMLMLHRETGCIADVKICSLCSMWVSRHRVSEYLLFELLSLCRHACEAPTQSTHCIWVILFTILILKASVQDVVLSIVPSALLPLSPQRSGWQMFGWLARHNKCVAGRLRWLLLAVLWVLQRQDRTGRFRRLFLKAGNIRTEDRSNVEDLFSFYMALSLRVL